MLELLGFISYLLTIYVYILIAAAVLSWLVAFNVVNTRHGAVAMIAASVSAERRAAERR